MSFHRSRCRTIPRRISPRSILYTMESMSVNFSAIRRNVLKGAGLQRLPAGRTELSADPRKDLIRKIREIILAQRVEEAFEKSTSCICIYQFLHRRAPTVWRRHAPISIKMSIITWRKRLFWRVSTKPSDYFHIVIGKARARQLRTDPNARQGFYRPGDIRQNMAKKVAIAPKE